MCALLVIFERNHVWTHTISERHERHLVVIVKPVERAPDDINYVTWVEVLLKTVQ